MLVDETELEKNETCRRLVAAASEEFAQHGYASARVRTIAVAAHVNLAAVNYYFGSKEGLYRATLRSLASQRPAARVAANRRGGSPQERLYRRVFALLDRFVGGSGPTVFGRILAHEAMDPTAHFETVIEAALRPDLDHISASVRELAGSGVTEAEITHTAIGVLGQCLLYQFAKPAIQRLYPDLPGGADLCRALARHISDMTVAGIASLGERHKARGEMGDSKGGKVTGK
jgi:TetR/AcrR family transcriptional regulator, regulator of cefoperazone and chloramphenicol sensitivity